jgi:hypothetical protein
MSRKKKKEPSTSSIYRSKLEGKVAELLPFIEYETTKLKYTVPASKHTYTTDFKLSDTRFIEVKGYLTAADRKKYLLVKEQHPDIELVFFFDKSQNKIHKNSPTTYAMWCDANGFRWTDLKQGLPKDWLK